MPVGYTKHEGQYSLRIIQTLGGSYWLDVDGVEIGLFDKPMDALADLANGHITTVIGADPKAVFRSADHEFALNLDEWTETVFPLWEDLK